MSSVTVALLLTISGPAQAISLSRSEVGGAPGGYTTYDFFATIDSQMGVMELLMDTDTAGDIYQVSLTPDDASETYDSYVTVGYPAAGEQPANTFLAGGAVDLGGGLAYTFTNQNIDIAWAPAGSVKTGAGQFHIARITLKDTARGSWTLGGWEFGNNEPSIISGFISIPGDVDGDGWVEGDDLAIVINNWGRTGLGPAGGDLNVNGTVDEPDYNEVVSSWGNGTPVPEPPNNTPEPASLGLLLLGSLLVLRRRRG